MDTFIFISTGCIYALHIVYDTHICLYCILFNCVIIICAVFYSVIIIHNSFVEWKCSRWMQVWGVSSCAPSVCVSVVGVRYSDGARGRRWVPGVTASRWLVDVSVIACPRQCCPPTAQRVWLSCTPWLTPDTFLSNWMLEEHVTPLAKDITILSIISSLCLSFQVFLSRYWYYHVLWTGLFLGLKLIHMFNMAIHTQDLNFIFQSVDRFFQLFNSNMTWTRHNEYQNWIIICVSL